jgi:hypothetical protein
MLPTMWPGDILTIQSAACEELIAGDIVLILRDNRFFAHRLVERRGVPNCLSWITRGDAMPHNDPPAGGPELLGRVTGIRRGNRSFVPSRRLSLFDSVLAWILCRWNRFRNFTLHIHAASLEGGPTRAGQFFRGVCGALRGISGIAAGRTSDQ